MVSFNPGDTIGSYRVVRALGEGGMGAVYEVAHEKLGVYYALKTFILSDGYADLFRKRFQAEGKILARLNFPGIVRFFELYQPVIKKFAEYAGAKYDSEDVAQDVFVKLVEVFRRGGYQPEKGSFRSYLATMIRREVINRWHKAQVRGAGRYVSIDNDDSPFEVAVPSETAAILDAKWRLAEHAAAVEHILTKTALAQKSKDVYREYVLKERPIGEVAKAFGIPNNSVSQIKTRVERMIADYEAMIKD